MNNEENIHLTDNAHKKSGRGRSKGKKHLVIKRQKRFVIDYSGNAKRQESVVALLTEANQKPHGKEITIKDLVDYALDKIGPRDLEKLQRLALSEMDKVQMLREKYNLKHGTNLSLGEFLAQKLKIA